MVVHFVSYIMGKNLAEDYAIDAHQELSGSSSYSLFIVVRNRYGVWFAS